MVGWLFRRLVAAERHGMDCSSYGTVSEMECGLAKAHAVLPATKTMHAERQSNIGNALKVKVGLAGRRMLIDLTSRYVAANGGP
jgi:hypothetical protein